MNAAALSDADLAQCDPLALAREHASLHELLPSTRLLGGCCGTDHRHVGEIVAAWEDA